MVALLTHFHQRNRFIYSINVLNFKGVPSVNTSLSVKYNKTLKTLLLRLYEKVYRESLVTNIALWCLRLIQAGCSALSNTYYPEKH